YNPPGAGWNFIDTSGLVANGSAFGNADAPEGTQAAFLQEQGSFSQTINFAAGTHSPRFQGAQRPGQTQTLQVQVDGSPVGTFTPAGTSYQTYTTPSFAVTAGSHQISFVGTSPVGTDNTAFIDSVSAGGTGLLAISGGATVVSDNPRSSAIALR